MLLQSDECGLDEIGSAGAGIAITLGLASGDALLLLESKTKNRRITTVVPEELS